MNKSEKISKVTHTLIFTHTNIRIGIVCRLSTLETAVGIAISHARATHKTNTHTHTSGDLRQLLMGLNAIQKKAIPFEKFLDLWAEFDSIAGSLDQRVFSTFAAMDLLSPAACDLAAEVDAARKKRRAAAAEDVVAPGSGSSTPLQNRAGACQCKTSPRCRIRCPCNKAGQQCTSKCLCGDSCRSDDFSD